MEKLEQVQEAQTLGDVEALINYYYELQQEEQRIKASKDIARDTISRSFQSTGSRIFYTDSGLLARVDTRISERINVREARALLSDDVFARLRQQSAVVTLSVRRLKERE